jgi:RNA polymerase primary sigma factor
MTSKTKPTPQKEQAPEGEESAPLMDRPLFDLSDAAINELIHMAKTRGHVTHDQIIALSKEVNSEQVEDILAKFSENGVNVVETEEASEEEPREEPEEEGRFSVRFPQNRGRRSRSHGPTILCACICAK